jgi:hypothetical protein
MIKDVNILDSSASDLPEDPMVRRSRVGLNNQQWAKEMAIWGYSWTPDTPAAATYNLIPQGELADYEMLYGTSASPRNYGSLRIEASVYNHVRNLIRRETTEERDDNPQGLTQAIPPSDTSAFSLHSGSELTPPGSAHMQPGTTSSSKSLLHASEPSPSHQQTVYQKLSILAASTSSKVTIHQGEENSARNPNAQHKYDLYIHGNSSDTPQAFSRQLSEAIEWAQSRQQKQARALSCGR